MWNIPSADSRGHKRHTRDGDNGKNADVSRYHIIVGGGGGDSNRGLIGGDLE